MRRVLSKNKFIIALGVFLIFVGLGIFLVSEIEIEGLETMLSNENLTIEEVWRFEGALQWWREIYITVTLPLSVFLIIAGVATLMVLFLLFILNEMSSS